tara:strand:- start:1138 stop:1566 length:429 start_codon:yes stop_codon:yes gene_type:complete
LSEELKSVDVAIHTYVLKFLGTLTAFATATVLLAVQGSIDTEGLASFFGIAFLMASIPFCSAAFVLNVKMVRLENAKTEVVALVDNFTSLVIALPIVGFLFILLAKNWLYSVIFGTSLVLAFFMLWGMVLKVEKLRDEDQEE